MTFEESAVESDVEREIEGIVLPDGLRLLQGAEGLALVGDEKRYGKPLSVDFVAGKAAHRRRFGGGRGQLVAKACGLAKGVTPSIVDATAGLGRDAFVLASLGAQVLLIERVAAIAALLNDGLKRATRHSDTADIAARMQLCHGDAAQSLADIVASAHFPPQVIHLDPMFPHREKSALVKKRCGCFESWLVTITMPHDCLKRHWMWLLTA